MLKRIAKRFAAMLFGRYELNRIYVLDLRSHQNPGRDRGDVRRIGPAEMRVCDDPLIRNHAWFAEGEDVHAFGLWEQGELVATCVFWVHDRLRNTLPGDVIDRGAFLVDLVTAARARGRGCAGTLLHAAASEMKSAGFQRLFARVWHTNRPSIRAFEKAGWSYVKFVATLTPLGYGKQIRLERRVRAV
jgi:GNAT superfamily N-acetyltransferase